MDQSMVSMADSSLVSHDPSVVELLESKLMKLKAKESQLIPGGLNIPDNYGNLALHNAIINNYSLYEINEILKNNENAISWRRTDGKLPIHLVKSYELLVFISEKYADGVRVKDQYGRLPIHYIIQNSQEYYSKPNDLLNSVKLLVTMYPESLTQKDKDNLIPLHYALQTNIDSTISFSLVEYLISVCPATIDVPILNEFEEKRTKLNNSPPKTNQLNINSASSPTKNAIDVVISMLTPDNRVGISTIHLALSQKEPNWDVVLFLIKTEPKLASIRGYSLLEQRGKAHFPLYVAVYKNCGNEVAASMINAYPPALHDRDDVNRYTPYHLIILKNLHQLLNYILIIDPMISLLYSLKVLCTDNRARSKSSWECLQILLNKHQEILISKQSDELKNQIPDADKITVLVDSDDIHEASTIFQYEDSVGGTSKALMFRFQWLFHRLLSLQAPSSLVYSVLGLYLGTIDYQYDIKDDYLNDLKTLMLPPIHNVLTHYRPTEMNYHSNVQECEKIVGYILEYIPSASCVVDYYGRTAIHTLLMLGYVTLADQSVLSSKIIQRILEISPSVASCKDSSGLLPIECFPTIWDHKDGTLTPDKTDIIMNNMTIQSSLGALLLYSLPLTTTNARAREYNEHKDIFFYIIADTNDCYYKAVDHVLQHFPSPKLLCNCLDKNDCKAVDIATPVTKRLFLSKIYFLGKFNFVQMTPNVHTDEYIWRLADYYDDEGNVITKKVSLVFYKRKEAYLNDKLSRYPHLMLGKWSLKEKYSVNFLYSYDGDSDSVFRDIILEKGYDEYNYCNVFSGRIEIAVQIANNLAPTCAPPPSLSRPSSAPFLIRSPSNTSTQDRVHSSKDALNLPNIKQPAKPQPGQPAKPQPGQPAKPQPVASKSAAQSVNSKNRKGSEQEAIGKSNPTPVTAPTRPKSALSRPKKVN